MHYECMNVKLSFGDGAPYTRPVRTVQWERRKYLFSLCPILLMLIYLLSANCFIVYHIYLISIFRAQCFSPAEHPLQRVLLCFQKFGFFTA